ncbi:hypothetical protein EDC04DRAFT_2580456 [Pisolithus marmoratus]|nr:hypothetical protein EDC04DRAFT_2580456 [Pisolithus marmoratus]
MDQCFDDQYATLQQQNLYYLFASGADWQLVSWLLCSWLSMAAIDDFLSLQLVCPAIFLFVSFLLNGTHHRSSNFPSLFNPQRSYAFTQKCYHLVHAGNCMISSLRFQLGANPLFTIEIHLNAFSRFLVTPSLHPTSPSPREECGHCLHG